MNPTLHQTVHRCRMLRLHVICCIAIIASGLVFISAPPAYGQSKVTVNAVRITITTRGLYLSQNTVRAGAVQLLIENRTLIKNPQLQVLDAKPGANTKVGIATAAGAARKNFQNVTLPPGSYILSLAADPAMKVSFEVKP